MAAYIYYIYVCRKKVLCRQTYAVCGISCFWISNVIYQIFMLNIQKAEQLAVIKMPDS